MVPAPPRSSPVTTTYDLLADGTPGSWDRVGKELAGCAGPASLVARCESVGREQAESGTPVGVALDGLRIVTQQVAGRVPTFQESRAVAEGWGDVILGHVRRATCVDPLTGLSSEAHLRTVLADWFGEAGEVRAALVVVQLPTPDEPFEHARRLALAGRQALAALPFGVRRVVALVPRTPDLSRRLRLLRRLLGDGSDQVWADPLAETLEAVDWLLDELRH
jgi:hypothetical protein